MTYAVPAEDRLLDGASPAEGCKALADAGAAVVGVNCYRGPEMTLALLGGIRAAVECPVAALPVPYRTTAEHPTFFNIPDHGCSCLPEGRAFPTALEPLSCNRYEMGAFALAAHEMGVDYLGVCCGAAPIHIRALAEAPGPHAARLGLLSRYVEARLLRHRRCAKTPPHRWPGSHVARAYLRSTLVNTSRTSPIATLRDMPGRSRAS